MRDQDIRIGSQLTTRRPGLKVLALVRPRQLVLGESFREFEGCAPGKTWSRAAARGIVFTTTRELSLQWLA